MTKKLTVPTESVSLANPASLMEFANTLKTFIVDQKLYVNIKGKNYVEVEGWQFAGAATGIMPVVVKVEHLAPTEDMNEIKYRAEVKLINKEGMKVGYGVAVCSNKEEKKKDFDEYAIASMAQTRATGKAYRNTFAWLMKIAGYEPTPAEEAGDIKAAPVEPDKTVVKQESATIVDDLLGQTNQEDGE